MKRYKQRLGVRFRSYRGDNYLAFRDRAYRLNELGTFIWAYLEESRSEDEIVQSILDAYEVDKSLASADCRAFLEEMCTAQLIMEA